MLRPLMTKLSVNVNKVATLRNTRSTPARPVSPCILGPISATFAPATWSSWRSF